MGKPRLPWRRGPAAWKIAGHSDEVEIRLHAECRKFLSLRRASAILGVSTQPIRDWVRLGYLKRDGPRRQISKLQLSEFLSWLKSKAQPFPSENYSSRLLRPGRPAFLFYTLS